MLKVFHDSNFQDDLLKQFFPLISLFQLYMHLKIIYQINALNTYVAENLQLITQSTFPGVLTGESCIGGVGTIFQA